jgi:hypothetical protein
MKGLKFTFFVLGMVLIISCSTSRLAIPNDVQRPKTIDILIKHGLNGIKVNYDMSVLESIETDDLYSYADALDLAIESYLTDNSNPGSPLAVVPHSINAYRGNASKPQQHLEKLRELINDGGSICMPDIEGASDQCFHAEEGEDVSKNWIFLLQVPELSNHKFWAIISKDGKEPVYNYGFK